jgi:hypothetical protein
MLAISLRVQFPGGLGYRKSGVVVVVVVVSLSNPKTF